MILEPEYQELEFDSSQTRDRAANQTAAATMGIQSLLIPSDRLEETLEFLKNQGYKPQVKPSEITDEDMWPTWPEDEN